jgi:hypothetical protein
MTQVGPKWDPSGTQVGPKWDVRWPAGAGRLVLLLACGGRWGRTQTNPRHAGAAGVGDPGCGSDVPWPSCHTTC